MKSTPSSASTQASSTVRRGVQANLRRDGDARGRFVKLPVELLARTDLTSTEKLVCACVTDMIGSNGSWRVGIRKIAKRCGVSNGLASRSVTRLRELGLLVADAPTGNPTGNASVYRLPERALNPLSAQPSERERSTGRTVSAQPTEHNQTHIAETTRSKRRAQATPDPWELAQTAMSGDSLCTDSFEAAWREWTEYRRQARKPLTPATIVKQIHTLEGSGHDRAIEAIDQSIRNGWTGLFPANENRRGGSPAAASTARVGPDPAKYARALAGRIIEAHNRETLAFTPPRESPASANGAPDTGADP